MTPRIQSIKAEISRIHEVARKRHLGGESSRRIVQGISDSIDGLLRSFFVDDLASAGRNVALVAVGGYGRRELCPYSDVDLLFLCDNLERSGKVVERMVRDLWDSGFELGHSVRSPKECLAYMKDDDVTAATMLEARFLAGSERLMRRFQEQSLTRYCKSHGESFVAAKLQALKNSIEGDGRTIFVTEPHIKEGMGCMRDIQRILWIERLRRNVLEFADIASHGGFSFEEVRRVEEAYEFYLRVRCELHFVNELRQDILEHDSQVEVARNLGYTEGDDHRAGIEKLMSDYYRYARDALRFIRFYLETKSRGTRFFLKLRHRLFSSQVSPNLSLFDGLLYLVGDPEPGPEKIGELILEIFAVAHENEVDLSQSVCEWIRRKLPELPENFARWGKTNKVFLRILRKGGCTGRILKRMNGVGVLGKIIPEFAKLYCLVTFDGHHRFTVDEHTLRTLRELDRIETQSDYREPEFRRVLERIRSRLPVLRLALLLHDIGKSLDGSHDAKGTELAVVIGERLGLDEETLETVEFLVYRHLEMHRFSERIDFTEDSVVASFANLVGTRDNLDMLYLLTYIDVHSVGPGSWTSWKGAQLAELYQLTCIHLETGTPPSVDTSARLASSSVSEERRAAILEHCRLIDHPAYERETVPERMNCHVEMVETFVRESAVQIDHEEMAGSWQITFCSVDRPHLFADLTGLLLSAGFNILSARIYSRRDGIVLDIFRAVPADDLRISMAQRMEDVQRRLERIERGELVVGDLVSDRGRRYRCQNFRKPLLPPRVRIYDDREVDHSVVEIHAGDRQGLLYDLSVALADLHLDVRSAKVSTMVDRARDLFLVTEVDGGKVSDPARRQEIAAALEAAAEWKDRRGVRQRAAGAKNSDGRQKEQQANNQSAVGSEQ